MMYEEFAQMIEEYSHLTEKEKDSLIFKGSVYDGIDFERLESWAEYDKINYASPRFKFANDDIIVVDKVGKLIKII